MSYQSREEESDDDSLRFFWRLLLSCRLQNRPRLSNLHNLQAQICTSSSKEFQASIPRDLDLTNQKRNIKLFNSEREREREIQAQWFRTTVGRRRRRRRRWQILCNSSDDSFVLQIARPTRSLRMMRQAAKWTARNRLEKQLHEFWQTVYSHKAQICTILLHTKASSSYSSASGFHGEDVATESRNLFGMDIVRNRYKN
jgi:hypothetical protein